MDPVLPERHRKPGVYYALTDDGVELPVIDITSAAFPVGVSDADLAAFAERSERFMKRWALVPGAVRQRLSRKSLLLREASGAPGGFMSGMTTYLNKLGPDNLGEYATGMDRRAAGMLPAVAVRMRLRAVARLLADGVTAQTDAGAAGAVHFVDLAGGPAADCLNALLVLRRDRAQTLAGRRVVIHVLDLAPAGPSFGARALAALRAEGAPLAGTDVAFDNVRYDWTDAVSLGAILDGFDLSDDDVVLVSSEGGLFEYGRDDDVAANLAVLGDHTPTRTVVVGSLFRHARLTAVMQRMSGMSFAARSPQELEALVSSSGWRLADVLEDNPVYHVVSLVRGLQTDGDARVH